MKRRRYTLEEQGFSEINITPFTDVILVLLIIFMITSPFLISGAFQVKLPKAASADSAVSKGVEVYLTEKNEIVIDGKTITQEDLIDHHLLLGLRLEQHRGPQEAQHQQGEGEDGQEQAPAPGLRPRVGAGGGVGGGGECAHRCD